MKASHTFKARCETGEVRITVFGTCEHDVESPSWVCPGGESFDMLTLTHCEVEYQKYHDDCADVIDGDMVGCGGFDLCFPIPDEAGILAYCKAWNIDPMNDMGPDDIEEDDDGPDPDDARDAEIDRHGVDRSADAEGKRIDDAYERHVQAEMKKDLARRDPC